MLERALTLALAALPAGAPPQPAPVAVRVDAIVAPDGSLGAGGWIVVRNGRIESIGQAQPPAGTSSFEIPGGVAAPGFIDVATALGAQGQLAEPARAFTPEVVAGDAFEADHSSFLAAARAGVTTVALMPSGDNVIGGRLAIVRTADDDGRGALLVGPGPLRFTLTEEPFGGLRVPNSRMGALPQLRELLAKGNLPATGTNLVEAESADQIRVAIELFTGAGKPFALLGAARADDALELLAGKSQGAVVGPYDLDTGERDLRLAQRLHERGVPVAWTARGDGGALRLTAALATRAGLDAKAARLALATVPARLLGIDGECGTLEAGRRADLVVLDGDPLDLAAKVKLVLVGGAAVAAKEEGR